MLGDLFVASLAAIPLAALYLAVPTWGRTAGRAAAAFLSLVTAGVGAAVLAARHAPTGRVVTVGVILALLNCLWLPVTRRWRANGHAAWAALASVVVIYSIEVLVWTRQTAIGRGGRLAGTALWVFELVAFALVFMFAWEVLDVATRRRWRRRCPDGVDTDTGPWPVVSIHVPIHNEPPDLVITTLRSLLELDYPAYEIVVIDNNTTDRTTWVPVASFCEANNIEFHHLDNWPGYKAGALNYGLRVTHDQASIIAVVDADYVVDTDFLRRCVPLFRDPKVAFVQTPQDYRDWRASSYFRRVYYAYEYFFAVSQASRNERDGAIFGGTMGLIRKSALQAVGGWDEWCITEDAELSLRLLRAGWSGQHVERPFGRGLMPLTFEALKRQRFRWSFGGVQILRKHWRSLLPWDRSPDNQLSLGQRYDYLVGGLQWFSNLMGVLFGVFLLYGAFVLTSTVGVAFRRVPAIALVVPPVVVTMFLARGVALLRSRSGSRWRDAAGAMGVWLALAWTVAMASAAALVRSGGVFLRTPKTKGKSRWQEALRANQGEAAFAAALGLGGLVSAVSPHGGRTAAILSGLLLWHGFGFALAPWNSMSARRAEEPEGAAAVERARSDATGWGSREQMDDSWDVAWEGLVTTLRDLALPPPPTLALLADEADAA